MVSDCSDSISTRRLSCLAFASALLVGVAGALSGEVVVVEDGVGSSAIAGTLISESGSVRAAIKAAWRRVRVDKLDAGRRLFTPAFRKINKTK